MGDWWANIYSNIGHASRYQHPTREHAVIGSRMYDGKQSPMLTARIHVRLKPEGAPKRYADDYERYHWEHIRNAGPAPGSVEWAVAEAAKRAAPQVAFLRRAFERANEGGGE